MTEPLTRQEILDQREAYLYSSDHVRMCDTALYYEAKLREFQEVQEAVNAAIAEVGPVLGVGQFPHFGNLVAIRNARKKTL